MTHPLKTLNGWIVVGIFVLDLILIGIPIVALLLFIGVCWPSFGRAMTEFLIRTFDMRVGR